MTCAPLDILPFPHTNPTPGDGKVRRIASLLKQADDALLLLQSEIAMSRAAAAKTHRARAALCELEVAILFNEPINQNQT